MPTIITHIKPHIDDICAAWLLKRYLPAWRQANIEFAFHDQFDEPAINTPDRTHVGIGLGEFDEHKGDIGECSASLVYAYINTTVVLNANERKALDKLVDWVLQEDTGKLLVDPDREFTVPAILEGQFLAKGRDSEAVYELGSAILDALLIGMRNQVDLEADWENKIEFDSSVGKAVAMISDARGADSFAYTKGFSLFVRQTKNGSYAEFRAEADSEIDLSDIKNKIEAVDSEATWFFHHSKKLLICGGELTSQARTTSLDLDKMIEMSK